MDREWEYYNHALVPTTAPHMEPDTSWIKDRRKWKELADGRYPLFVRWITDFDCQKETEWWYIIKDAPFDFDSLRKNPKRHIKQALRKCSCKKISAAECIEDLFRVYEEAYLRYKNADNRLSYEQFKEGCLLQDELTEYWGGYDQSGNMIGYMIVIVHEDYVEISSAKFSALYMNLQVSDALYYVVLDYYLNQEGKRYVSSGQRSINHITDTQEYKIRVFEYRKAYCKLHIRYRTWIYLLVMVLYPFRNILKKISGNTLIHQLTGVLKMEEIVRSQRK